MANKKMLEEIAWAVVDTYDPYELADIGGDEWGLFCETMWLLEEDPTRVLEYLEESNHDTEKLIDTIEAYIEGEYEEG